MPVIISLPDELAKKLQTEADARQQSINNCAIDFLERALENELLDTQSDFKMLGTQMRATPTPAPALQSKEASETKKPHHDDASDFEKIGEQIRTPAVPSSVPSHKDSNQNRSDTSSTSFGRRTSFKSLGVQRRGKPAAIASTGWLLDPSVSPINDHKYRADLEQWSSMWVKVKVDMKYEQRPLI